MLSGESSPRVQPRAEIAPPGAATEADRSRPPRPSRRPGGRALSGALPATFIGMLLVHAFRPGGAYAAEQEGEREAPIPPDGHSEEAGAASPGGVLPPLLGS